MPAKGAFVSVISNGCAALTLPTTGLPARAASHFPIAAFYT